MGLLFIVHYSLAPALQFPLLPIAVVVAVSDDDMVEEPDVQQFAGVLQLLGETVVLL